VVLVICLFCSLSAICYLSIYLSMYVCMYSLPSGCFVLLCSAVRCGAVRFGVVWCGTFNPCSTVLCRYTIRSHSFSFLLSFPAFFFPSCLLFFLSIAGDGGEWESKRFTFVIVDCSSFIVHRAIVHRYGKWILWEKIECWCGAEYALLFSLFVCSPVGEVSGWGSG